VEELHETNGENLFNRGKVRDIYEMDDGEHLIIITTDRTSVFDQVFPNPIPGKGVYLNRLSNFWFDFLDVRDHRVSMSEVPEKELDDFLGMEEEVQDRLMVVRKAEPFPVEVVLRAYLVGSGWKEYEKNGTVCGHPLPDGLKEGDLIPDGPILTPATKAQEGEHDENISPKEAAEIVGAPWEVVVEMAFDIFNRAAKHCFLKGLILVDTKFEFGMVDGEVTLIDEVLTPDSSRYWSADREQQYDKQYVRDWLVSTGWKDGNKMPDLPDDVIEELQSKYKRLVAILTR
jgi:phosphoribosylaminoimidazole-succinocarboxamide synthase